MSEGNQARTTTTLQYALAYMKLQQGRYLNIHPPHAFVPLSLCDNSDSTRRSTTEKRGHREEASGCPTVRRLVTDNCRHDNFVDEPLWTLKKQKDVA